MGVEDTNESGSVPSLRLGRVSAPRMPQLEALWDEHAANNPAFLTTYQRLKVMLDGETIDVDAFQNELQKWNDAQGEGYWGDVVKKEHLKHGKIKVYCNPESGKIRFGFGMNQDSMA